MKKVIKNIKQIVGTSTKSEDQIKKGESMSKISVINNGWLTIENDTIIDFGNMDEWRGIEDWNNIEIIDANNGILMPTFCDSHTHIVYAGNRVTEFIDRINGLSYEEIAQNGGGILNSAKLLSETDENSLFNQSARRLEKLIKLGTGAIEIKSGYGLNTKDEIKILRVIQQLKEKYPITIKSTFLGAHAVPNNMSQEKYTKLIINEMIPEVSRQNLAEYIDVFCDKGFFTEKETEQILLAGIKHGLKPKIHANELAYSGGIQVGVRNNAVSVDHLQFTSNKEIKLLKKSNTMPTLLPGTAYFLGLKYPPARMMIDAGLPIALASDYNPGSCPTGNMSTIISLACTQMHINPNEAINAATINGAYAMEVNDNLGSIQKNKKANLVITNNIPSLGYIPYSIGENFINKVIINGKIYYDSETNS
ncbi:MAG: imidazolonepropionase [Flavobacteriales bacterium]|jgi:imidazolonepropionase|nr:imidazolonepropionase [Flavobacteriales bacterium]